MISGQGEFVGEASAIQSNQSGGSDVASRCGGGHGP